MRTVKLCLLCAICLLISVISSYASEESLTITTYYPSPYGSYHELRSQRIAIGDTYINGATYSWDGASPTINADADLVVEGNVGIGTTNPQQSLHVAGSGILVTGTATVPIASSGALDYTGGGTRIISRGANTSTRGTFDVNIQASDGLPLNIIPISVRSNGDVILAQSTGNVGIGTPDPQATLQLNGTAKIFGTPITSGLSPSVVYQAASDGFVSAFSNKDTAWVRAFTGPTNPPAIEWGRHTKAGEGGVLMPVRKGEYWMVTITEEPQIRWIPFGN